MLRQNFPSWELDAFEPYISSETMFVHVNQLHKGYVDKLNREVSTYILARKPSNVLRNLGSYFDDTLMRDFYRDMMGGNVAHTLFWKSISPQIHKGGYIKSVRKTSDAIISEVVAEGLKRVGSGWVWGVITQDRRFRIYSTRNHDVPYMRGHVPIFCVDLWEHAYFLDQHGDRKAWLENVCSFLDWDFINQRISNTLLNQPDELDFWVLGQQSLQ